MDLKEIFDKGNDAGFIKLTKPDPSRISKSERVALNRKGNELFNAGQYEKSKRIFLTTGYTDGLIRVGDYYFKNNNFLEALKMYWAAPAPERCDKLIEKMGAVVRHWLDEKKD